MGFAFTDKQEETCDLTLQVVSEKTHYGNFFDRNTNPLREIEATSKINTRKKQLTAIKPCWTSPKYDYDYQGRRISKKVSGQVTQYVYDGWNMIAEFDGLNAVQATHTWGQDLSGSMQGAGGVGGLLSSTHYTNDPANSTRAYPTYDANGNITQYLDESGVVQAHYQYDEFGKTLVKTGSKADDFNFRFSTKYNDQESGLLYYGYRSYNPTTGSWSNRDPIGERGGINLQAFVNNDGINYWDLLGMVCCSAEEAILRQVNRDIAFHQGEVSELEPQVQPLVTNINQTEGELKIVDTLVKDSVSSVASAQNIVSFECNIQDIIATALRLRAAGKALTTALGVGEIAALARCENAKKDLTFEQNNLSRLQGRQSNLQSQVRNLKSSHLKLSQQITYNNLRLNRLNSVDLPDATKALTTCQSTNQGITDIKCCK